MLEKGEVGGEKKRWLLQLIFFAARKTSFAPIFPCADIYSILKVGNATKLFAIKNQMNLTYRSGIPFQ